MYQVCECVHGSDWVQSQYNSIEIDMRWKRQYILETRWPLVYAIFINTDRKIQLRTNLSVTDKKNSTTDQR